MERNLFVVSQSENLKLGLEKKRGATGGGGGGGENSQLSYVKNKALRNLTRFFLESNYEGISHRCSLQYCN
jgi:hypothetical protein